LFSLRAATTAAISVTLIVTGASPAVADDPDVTGPTASIETSWPNVVGKGSHTVWASVTDPAGVERVEWWADGAPRSLTDRLDYDFGTRQRSLVVELHAWDKLGNKSVTTYPVTVDATPPQVVSFIPVANKLVRGTELAATLRVSDQSAVFHILPLSGPTEGRTMVTQLTAKFPLPTEGKHNLPWYVVDVWGNWANLGQPVIADSIKPKLTMAKAPSNKAKVKGKVGILATASDKYGVARVELLVNGKLTSTDPTAAYQFSIDTAKYGKTIKVQLRAYDKAGNVITTPLRTWYR
jgi:hypothetical protein